MVPAEKMASQKTPHEGDRRSMPPLSSSALGVQLGCSGLARARLAACASAPAALAASASRWGGWPVSRWERRSSCILLLGSMDVAGG